MLEQESKRNNTTTDTDGSSSRIAIAAGGGSSSCSTSSGDISGMVSLTIPMFRPLNECSSANGSSDETPNESWVGFKVMAKRDKTSEVWTLCEITRVVIHEKTSQIQFDVLSYRGSGDTT